MLTVLVLCVYTVCTAGGHTEVVKLLLHFGANIELKTKSGMTPIDFAGCGTESWNILHTVAEHGVLPELPVQTDVVPEIPWFALTIGLPSDSDKNKRDKKKGQKKRIK